MNRRMEIVHNYPDLRYWSEVLFCTILTHRNDLEVKVRELEKKYIKVFG